MHKFYFSLLILLALCVGGCATDSLETPQNEESLTNGGLLGPLLDPRGEENEEKKDDLGNPTVGGIETGNPNVGGGSETGNARAAALVFLSFDGSDFSDEPEDPTDPEEPLPETPVEDDTSETPTEPETVTASDEAAIVSMEVFSLINPDGCPIHSEAIIEPLLLDLMEGFVDDDWSADTEEIPSDCYGFDKIYFGPSDSDPLNGETLLIRFSHKSGQLIEIRTSSRWILKFEYRDQHFDLEEGENLIFGFDRGAWFSEPLLMELGEVVDGKRVISDETETPFMIEKMIRAFNHSLKLYRDGNGDLELNYEEHLSPIASVGLTVMLP